MHAVSLCVQVIPCHRVSARGLGSPVTPVVSRRAGRWLYELTRIAPRGREGKKKNWGLWENRKQ